MHMPAALYADSQDNQRTYMRVSSSYAPASAEAGSQSQPIARKSRWTAAADTPCVDVSASGQIDRPMRLLLAAAG